MDQKRSGTPTPELDDSPAVLHGLFAQSPSAYLVYDLDGHCVMANEACDLLFGGKPPPGYNIFKDEQATQQGLMPLLHRQVRHGRSSIS